MTETSSNALQIIIDEFKNIIPEITISFMFKKNGEIIACNEAATEEQSKKLIASFNSIADHALAIADIETLSIQGADGQLDITAMNKRYLATASSRAADAKIIKSFTTVIIPTVLKLSDQIGGENEGNSLPQAVETEPEPVREIVLPDLPTANDEMDPVVSASFSSELPLPQTPANQFMVEKIGGLMIPSDTVRVDGEVIAKWRDLYGDKEIIGVQIKTLEGKAATCKFKPLKEANQTAKGIIQIPDKILQTLQTSKGKLVIVNPVITQSEETDS